jgi:hypothetical protein
MFVTFVVGWKLCIFVSSLLLQFGLYLCEENLCLEPDWKQLQTSAY